MKHSFISAIVLLLMIVDPVGNIPIFVQTLRGVPDARRSRVVLREVGIAFVLLLTFMLVGEGFLRLMGLSSQALQIAGGIVLLLIALRLIFPAAHLREATIDGQEPFIVPLAIPYLAGPSALATVMLLVSQEPELRWQWIAALVVTMVVCAGLLVLAARIQRLVGERVLVASERLIGLVLIAVAVQMVLTGLRGFIGSL